MMLTAAAQGALAGDWELTEPASADVIVTAAGVWKELDRVILDNPDQIVAVVAGDTEELPPGILSLRFPIDARALLELLALAEHRALTAVASHTADPEHPLIHLARLLRATELPVAYDVVWRITGLSRAPIHVAPGQRQLFSTESLLGLQHVDILAEIDVTSVSLAELQTEGMRAKPLAMLQWSIGLRTGALGLLPWLAADTTFQLRAFPEFQILHHEPAHRRLAAALSRPIAGIRAAMGLLRLDLPTVIGFVNAADLCGYLDSHASAPDPQARRASGSRGKLAQLMRRALGLEQPQ